MRGSEKESERGYERKGVRYKTISQVQLKKENRYEWAGKVIYWKLC